MTVDLDERRLVAVREHMESENEQDFDRTIATFAHPRYELMATGEVFDGEAEVRDYFARTRADFPDQRNDNSVLRSTSDGVVVEFDLLGTHADLGTTFRSRMLALFLFEDGGDRIVCERVYFDTASIRRQLLSDGPGSEDASNSVRVDRDDVMRWVAGYERAWRDGDLAAVEQLFTDDAHYRPSPYDESEVGHEAIKALWLDDEGEVFTVHAEPFAVEGRDAVVRVEVRYGDPVRQEYRDLWLLRFAHDGRVEDFEEWAYWPGKPHSAADE